MPLTIQNAKKLTEIFSFMTNYFKEYAYFDNFDTVYKAMIKFSKSSDENKNAVFVELTTGNTISLREFCKINLGFDYWGETMEETLFAHNNINHLDSANYQYRVSTGFYENKKPSPESIKETYVLHV